MSVTGTPLPSPENASCIYQTQSEFILRWGLKNTAVVSNKDQTTTVPNQIALQQAFDYAVGEIHNYLRGGVVAVPLDFSHSSLSVVPTMVKNWCSVIAYCFLYFDRGRDEKNKDHNKMKRLLEEQYDEMKSVRQGILQIEASPSSDSSSQTVSHEGSAISFPEAGYHGCTQITP